MRVGPAVRRTGFPGKNVQNVRWGCSPSLFWPHPLPTLPHTQPSGFSLINGKAMLVGECVDREQQTSSGPLGALGAPETPQGPPGAPWVHLENWEMTWNPQDSRLAAGPPRNQPVGACLQMFQATLGQVLPPPWMPSTRTGCSEGLGFAGPVRLQEWEAPRADAGGVRAGVPQAWPLSPGVSQDFRGMILPPLLSPGRLGDGRSCKLDPLGSECSSAGVPGLGGPLGFILLVSAMGPGV